MRRCLALVGVLVATMVAYPSPSAADHPWRGGIHWPTGMKHLTVVDRTADTAWNDAIRLATENWGEVGGDHYELTYEQAPGDCGTEATTVNADTHNPANHLRNGSRISVCTANVTDNTAYAFAFADSAGHIGSAYILVKKGSYSATSRRHLMAHELGHLLGLDHTSRTDSVMGPDWSVVAPGPHDCEQVHINNHHNDDESAHAATTLTCGPSSGETPTTTTTTTTAPPRCWELAGVRFCG